MQMQELGLKQYEGVAERILKFLGQGIPAERVASVIGCDNSYISQLLAEDDFKQRVQELKFANLTEATDRDRRYDKLEDKLLEKIEDDISKNPFAFKSTSEKVRNLSVINSLKRRGAGADSGASHISNTVIQLVMPTRVREKFEVITNSDNQILRAGEQDLITMQSNSIEGFATATIGSITSKEKRNEQQTIELE